MDRTLTIIMVVMFAFDFGVLALGMAMKSQIAFVTVGILTDCAICLIVWTTCLKITTGDTSMKRSLLQVLAIACGILLWTNFFFWGPLSMPEPFWLALTVATLVGAPIAGLFGWRTGLRSLETTQTERG